MGSGDMNKSEATVFVYKDGRQVGPYTERELRTHWANRVLNESDLVWRQGMADYVSLSDYFNIRVTPVMTPIIPESEESAELRSEIEDIFSKQKMFIQESPEELQKTSRLLQGICWGLLILGSALMLSYPQKIWMGGSFFFLSLIMAIASVVVWRTVTGWLALLSNVILPIVLWFYIVVPHQHTKDGFTFPVSSINEKTALQSARPDS